MSRSYIRTTVYLGFFRDHLNFALFAITFSLQIIQYAVIISGIVCHKKIFLNRKKWLLQIKKKLYIFPIFADFVTHENPPDVYYVKVFNAKQDSRSIMKVILYKLPNCEVGHKTVKCMHAQTPLLVIQLILKSTVGWNCNWQELFDAS